MLTPQEVADKTFKQAFVGGYDMPSVDEFLEKLTEDYTNLYKENAVLKNKMKVLVDKLEEYRGNEDNIRQAYLAIRSQAEKELEDARVERDRILSGAQSRAEQYTGDIEDMVAKEQKRLEITREQTASFVHILKECYARQVEQLDIILTASMEDSPKKKHDDAIRAAAQEIDASLAAMEGFRSEAFPVENAPAGDTEGDAPEDATKPLTDVWDRLALSEEPPSQEAPSQESPSQDEDMVYSIQQSLTATFGEEVDWTPEEVSEVRRPSFDFSSLPGNFGHKRRSEEKRGKR